jgi:antitoxin MazE
VGSREIVEAEIIPEFTTPLNQPFIPDDHLTSTLHGYTLLQCISMGESGMQVAKWGNSLAVRLPAVVVEALGLREGDEIEIHVADGRQFGVARKPGRDELLKRLRTFRGRLPADFKFDRDEANAR